MSVDIRLSTNTGGDIIIRNAQGAIRAQYDGTNTWTFTGIVRHSDTQNIAYAAAITPDAAAANNFIVGALTGNITVNAPLNPRNGQIITFNYTGDATLGRTITYNAVFKTSSVPVSTANGKASQMFIFDGTNWIQTGGPLVWL